MWNQGGGSIMNRYSSVINGLARSLEQRTEGNHVKG